MFSFRNQRTRSNIKASKEDPHDTEVTDVDSVQVEDQIVAELRSRIAELEEQLEVSEMNRKILKENFAMENEDKLRLIEEVAALKAELALYTNVTEEREESTETIKEAEEIPLESLREEYKEREIEIEAGDEEEEALSIKNTEQPREAEEKAPLSPVIEVETPDLEEVVESFAPLQPLESEEVIIDEKVKEPSCSEPVVLATAVEEWVQTDEIKLTVKNALGDELSLAEAEALIQAQHREIVALTREMLDDRNRDQITSPHRVFSPTSGKKFKQHGSSGCFSFSLFFIRRSKKQKRPRSTILS